MVVLEIIFAIATIICLLGAMTDTDWKKYLILMITCVLLTLVFNFVR